MSENKRQTPCRKRRGTDGWGGGEATRAALSVIVRALLLFLSVFSSAFSQEDSSKAIRKEPPTSPLLQYRRWLAPQDRIEDWPLGKGRYLPLRRDLFELWTDFLKESPDLGEEPMSECLSRIVLHAKLEGRQLVEGRGYFDLRLPPPPPMSDRAAVAARRSGLTARSTFRSIPLDSWGLWIDAPALDDGTPVSIVQTANGDLRLILPQENSDEQRSAWNPSRERSTGEKRVRFSWSLRSRIEAQGRLQFDLQLPTCRSVELNLDLPEFLIPSISQGIVLETPTPDSASPLVETPASEEGDSVRTHSSDPETVGTDPIRDSKRRRWRLLPAQQSRARFTISLDEQQDAAQRKTAFLQRILYNIAPQGMDVTTRIHFDKEDPFVGDLLLELDEPLRPVEVRYGDRIVPWSPFSTGTQTSASRILVDLAEQGKGELRELRIVALAPTVSARPWNLPRIRVVSPSVFWKETRSGVIVQDPLSTRRLSCEQAVQINPVTTTDRAGTAIFAFQYFEDDARITVDLDYHVPETILNSFVQVLWGGNEITGSMVVDCSLAEGDLYTLEFPVSDHWTINEVKTIFEDAILSWDIVERKDTKGDDDVSSAARRTLSIQLKRPLRPREGLRLQIRGRLQAASRTEWRLADVAPLSLPRRRDESHFIAIRPDAPFHLRYLSPVPPSLEIRDPFDPRLSPRFVDPPQGTVFPLDAQSQEIRFTTERLKPSYSAEIEGTIQLKEHEFVSSYRIRCQPIDSSVDRLYVHFTPENAIPDAESSDSPSRGETGLRWSCTKISTESLQEPAELQIRRVVSPESDDLIPSRSSGAFSDEKNSGAVWEVRLPSPQTGPFELEAVATIPLAGETSIPLASLPAALSQKGDVYVQSSRLHPYRIVNSRLRSVPIAPTEWYRYQETRAAFRYDPAEEFRSPLPSPLSLVRIESETTPPAAWVWSLRLDSQYENEGTVKSNAVFFLENRGKKDLRLALPEGVRIGDVQAVWLNDDRASWYPDSPGETIEAEGVDRSERERVVVTLPESTRFVSVSLEYSYRDLPLTRRRALNSRCPTADVPILAVSRSLWLPPEFEVRSRSFQRNAERGVRKAGSGFSKAIDLFLARPRFNPLSKGDWKRLSDGGRNRRESIRASQTFLDWIPAGIDLSAGVRRPAEDSPAGIFVSETSFLHGGIPAHAETTWSELFSNEKTLAGMLSRTETTANKGPYRDRLPNVRLLIDGPAFASFGMTPTTPIRMPDASAETRRGAEILNQNGLILLVSSEVDENGENAFVFFLTTFLAAAVHDRDCSEAVGNGVRYLPNTTNYLSPKTDLKSSASVSESPTDTRRWIPADQWIRKSSAETFPWPVSSQSIRLASITPDWGACEIPQGVDTVLYAVHRDTVAAFYWIAFLAAIVLTWKKPFSSPVCLLLLLLFFELAIRWSFPGYEEIPGGAFLGTFVSLAFGLIRSRSRNDRYGSSAWRRLQAESSAFPAPTLREDSRPRSDRGENESRAAGTAPPSGQNAQSPSIQTEVFFNRIDLASQELSEDGPTAERDDPSAPSGGPVLRTIVFFLAGLSLLGVAAEPVRAQTLPTASTTVASLEDAPPDIGLQERKRSESGATPAKEPYRVFFPVDQARQIIGNDVWVPEDFFLALYRSTQRIVPRARHRWSIESARYEGSLSNNPLTPGMSISHFKVVFEILLAEEKATITLPPFPLSSDGAFWDSAPIQPTWRIRDNHPAEATPSGENSLLAFEIENEKKGRHVLELHLAPKINRMDDTRSVSIEIPKVPRSVLRLNVPPESPAINISDCLGAVVPNTIVSPTLKAETGPSGRIAFSWIDEPVSGEPASVQVESFHWLRARPTQVDIRTKFRYRIEGGRIRHLNIRTDPRWQISGQYHCEEHPIDRVETHYELIEAGEFPSHGEVARLVFKTPVSGSLTIRAGFVLKDFSGIGRVRPPRIGPLQSRIVKSMLAVSAEPILEVDTPTTGLGVGFESGWYGTQTPPIVPGLSTVAETAALGMGETSATPQERPLAEYDLTKITPSWTLAIRKKKVPPRLKLTQAYRFDHGDSSVLCVGDFLAEGEMFQQSFSAPDSFKIESVELRDAQNNLVEIVSGEAVRATESKERVERTIFFKRALSGAFRISVLGHFSWGAKPVETQDPVRRRESVPFLHFQNVALDESRMEFFRTSAILAEVRVDEAVWTRSEVAPVAPKFFSDPLIVGSWKAIRNDIEHDNELARAELPVPTFSILPNRPIVHGETIASLSRSATAGAWEATYDISWNITRGELEALRFRWDERFGSILSVEPPIPWTLEQKNGRSHLLLSPRIPFSGLQHFRIRTSLNPAGDSVSLPGITPVPEKFESFDSKTYVVLPRESEGELLPWNLEMLVPVDRETIESLKARMDKTLSGEKPVVSTSAPWNPGEENAAESPANAREFAHETASANAGDSEPLYFRATGDAFVAAIVPRRARPVATLFDIGLFIKKNGDVFGAATFDLKTRGNESFILKMPEDFELIRIDSAGMAAETTFQGNRRWKVDLCASDYPQRLGLLFRGAIRSFEGNGFEGSGRRLPFSRQRLLTEKTATSIPLPLLENVDVRETLWTLSFESEAQPNLPALTVSSLREERQEDHAATGAFLKREVAESLGRQTPVSGLEASQTLLKLDLVRLDHLLFVLDSAPVPSPMKLSEVKRWYSQWANEWFAVVSMIDDQKLRYPTVLHSDEHAVLIDSSAHSMDGSTTDTVGAFLDFIKVPESTLQALLVRHRQLAEKLGFPPIDATRRFSFSNRTMLHGREPGTDDAFRLFGTTEGHLKELRIVSPAGSSRWSQLFWNRSPLWLAIPVLLLFFLQRISLTELFERFPHFWGAAAGFLFWSLFPPGVFGLSLLLLVFVSLFYPVWPRQFKETDHSV